MAGQLYVALILWHGNLVLFIPHINEIKIWLKLYTTFLLQTGWTSWHQNVPRNLHLHYVCHVPSSLYSL